MKTYIFNDRVEKLISDMLILPIFSDEKPLKGITAAIDWRLCGKISKLLISEQINGDFNEKTIFSPKGKLKIKNLFLVGLGDKKSFDETKFVSILEGLFQTINNIKTQNFSIPISKFATSNISFEKSISIFFDILSSLKDKYKDIPDTHYIIVTDEEELRRLANCMKKVERQTMINPSIEVIEARE